MTWGLGITCASSYLHQCRLLRLSHPQTAHYWRKFCLKALLVKWPDKHMSSEAPWISLETLGWQQLGLWRLVFIQQTFYARIGKRESTISSSKNHKNDQTFHLESQQDQEEEKF